MAASAPVEIHKTPESSPYRAIVVSGTTLYPNAWVAVISDLHASSATIGGQIQPYDATAGGLPIGRAQTPSGNKPDYSAAASDGSITGDGTLTASVSTEERILQHQAVTGASGVTDAGKAIYLVDDDTLTLTKGAPASLAGTAVGYVLKYEGTGTLCTVVEFSRSQIYQSLIEETVIA